MTQMEHREATYYRYRLHRLMDSSEIAFMSIIFAWGLQMGLFFMALGRDPISAEMTSLTPFVPLPLHGGLLLLLVAVHMACILAANPGARRRCIGAECLFFLYVLWSLGMHNRFGLDFSATSIYLVFSVLNFHSLMRPFEVHRE